MSDVELGIKERAALLALMAVARKLSNTEMEKITGFRLTGGQKDRLNRLELVETDTSSKPYVHQLTDDGRAWCTKELSAGVPKSAGSAGGALYALLAGLDRYLSRANLTLSDIFQANAETSPPPMPPAEDLESRIRAAYRKIRKEPRDWVSLTRLRPLLSGVSKRDVDVALQLMNRMPDVNVVPQSNQKVLSPEDRKSTVRIGNEDRLLLSIDEP